MTQTETEIVQEIGSGYAVKYGFSNPDDAKAEKKYLAEYSIEMNRLIQMEGSVG